MDGSISNNMMQSSEMDTIMETNNHADNINASAQNGFIDPQVFSRGDDIDPDSTEDPSQEDSETSSLKPGPVTSRTHFLPSGCCYDDRMKWHANADHSANPHHPEDPRRIGAIFEYFKAAGLIYNGSELELREILKRSPTEFMYRIAARPATPAEICLVHEPSHFAWVQELNNMSSQQLRDLTTSFDAGRKSLYVGNLTEPAAAISAGGAIETCKSVLLGKVKNAIAVIRPPGHHAEANESLGFCIYNNVAVAAAVCMQDYPEICRKVLILDWDVHHGNGIQNMFYENPNVLYISLHVYSNGQFYPGQPDNPEIPDGGLDKCGSGPGIGRNINIGWADQGMGDGEYMSAFQRIVMPIAREFDPDLVIISAGFDAAAGDELGGCYVSPGCYAQMTHMLMSLADGKVAVCLEGGYNLQAISRSALAVAKTLMGEPPERINVPPLNRDAAFTLDNVKRIQAQYWDCMRPGVVPFPEFKEKDIRRLSDVIRNDERSTLAEKFNMTNIYIQRTGVSKAFANQVLATPDLYKAKKALVIVHDPPEVLAQPDPYNNIVHAHNAFVTNNILPYIEWAVSQGIAVVDISIPLHIEPPEVTDTKPPEGDENFTNFATKEVLSYLWDNYLQLCKSTPIVLMGVGDAYLGIKQILTARQDCRPRIVGVLSFVSGNLKPVRSETDDRLSGWYKSNSLIYVSPAHACWTDDESARKVKKKKFGNVVRAEIEVIKGEGPESSLWRMLKRHESEGTAYIESKFEEWEAIHGSAKDSDETESEKEGDVEMSGAEPGIVSERAPVLTSSRAVATWP